MQLAQHLAKKKILSADDLIRIAEARVASPYQPLHELLIERGFAKEQDVLTALAELLGIEMVDLTKVTIEPETLQTMPLKLVHRRSLMPIARQHAATASSSLPCTVNALARFEWASA